MSRGLETLKNALRTKRWLRRTLAGLVVVLALGYLVLPVALRGPLEHRLADTLGRRVELDGLGFDPLRLSVQAHGLRVFEADGHTEAAGFDRLRVNLELASLWRGGPVLSALELDAPRLRWVQQPDGTSNWREPLDRLAGGQTEPAAGGPPPFLIENLALRSGQIVFEAPGRGVVHRFAHLDLTLPRLSSTGPAEAAQPFQLDAQFDGATVRLSGQALWPETPPQARATLTLDALDLARLSPWLPASLGMTLAGGQAQARLTLAWAPPAAGALPELTVGGQLALRGLSLRTGDERELAGFEELTVVLQAFRPLSGLLALDEIALTGPRLSLRRRADGRLDLPGQPADPAPAASPPPAAGTEATPLQLQLQLGKLTVDGGQLAFEDLATPASRPLRLEGLHLHTGALAWPVEAPGSAMATFDFGFALEGGGQVRHEGRLGLSPLRLQGRLALEALDLARAQPYLHTLRPALALTGTLTRLAGRYRFEAGERPDWGLEDGSLHLEKLTLTGPGPTGEADRVGWGGLALEGVRLAARDRTLHAARLSLQAPAVRLRRDADGRLALFEALSDPAPAPAQPPAPAGDAAPWRATLAELDLAAGQLDLHDQALDGFALRLDELALQASSLSNDATQPSQIALHSRINGEGRLALAGQVQGDGSAANLTLTLTALPLPMLQPLLAPHLHIDLAQGSAGAQGQLHWQRKPAQPPEARFAGTLQVHDLRLAHRQDGHELLRWRDLSLERVALDSHPLAARIGQARAEGLFLRLGLDESGRLNLAQLPVAPPEGLPQSGTASARLPAKAARDWPVLRLDKLSLRGSSLDFVDRFIKPGYTLKMSGIEGELAGLSTDPDSLARLNLKARAASSSTVTVSGEFNPFRPTPALELRTAVRGFELSGLSPYAVRYIGYQIAGGSLSADLEYRIENQTLRASNQVFLDKLTLGEKVDSPDALNLPVSLAIALLKNLNGEISLDVPVSGSLDDPQFSIAGVVTKAVFNMVAKAVTAPFSLLAAAFGSAEENLSRIGFDAGYARLDEAAQERLQVLGQALTDRPALRLAIRPQVDAWEDRHGLRWSQIWDALHKARSAAGGPSREAAPIGGEEYPRLLRKVYVDTPFDGKPRNLIGMVKEATVPEMEARLLEHFEVDDNALIALGQSRAQNAKVWLAEKAGVAPERISIEPTRIVPQGTEEGFAAARIEFALH